MVGAVDVSGKAPSGVKFADLIRAVPLRTQQSRIRTSQRGQNLNRKLSELTNLNRFRRESVAVPDRRSAIREIEKPVQYQPNKRGILKCQAWQVQKLVPKPFAPSLPSNKYKVQYPHVQGDLEIYCPRCDMFFTNKEEYLDHIVIRQFKVPFVEKIKTVTSTDGVNEMEFHDTRNKNKMHFTKKRKNYEQTELLDEVKDLRDRARVIRKKRARTRRFDIVNGRLSKLRMPHLPQYETNDRRKVISSDYKDQVFLQLEQFKQKYLKNKQ